MDARKYPKLMIRTIRLISLSALVISCSACGGGGVKVVSLGAEDSSPWRFSRGGLESQGSIEAVVHSPSAYSGRLDVIWERGLKEKPQAPLTLSNGTLVVGGSKRKIFLIDPSAGKDITKYKNRSCPQSGGLLLDSLLYYSTAPPFNYLDCRRVENSKLLWRSVILDISAPLLAKDERLFALGGDGIIYCFNRFSGDLLWEKQVGGKMISAPALETRADGEALWVANSNGWIGAFDAASGKERYRKEVDESLVSSPAVQVDGTVYFSSQGGHAFTLTPNLDDTSKSDKFTLNKFRLLSPSWSAPALQGQLAVFADNTGHIYCFDSPDLSEPLWKSSLDGALVASPIIVGDFVVVGLLTGGIHTLSLTTGKVISSRMLESQIKYSPVSDGERIYVATQRKSLYCLGSLAR